MAYEQAAVFLILAAALVLFILERWRYDVVALLALLAGVAAGVVPGEDAFSGFGHPAVVTVAAVLVISRALRNSGVVDALARPLFALGNSPSLQVAGLSGFVAVLSGFINNVGALALMLPVGLEMARRSKRPPSYLLMPLAYGSLLGGMTTLIGTPPNIIIAAARAQTGAEPFSMFAFAPVGAGLAALGLAFMAAAGWRLLPARKGQGSREDIFHIRDYTAEVVVTAKSAAAGRTVGDIEEHSEGDAAILGVTRGSRKQLAPPGSTILQEGDKLLVEADSKSLQRLMRRWGVGFVSTGELGEEALRSDNTRLMEVVVRPESPLESQTVRALSAPGAGEVNLLAVARAGERLQERIGRIRFRAGDVLLVQGPADTLNATLTALGCLPLAERHLNIGSPPRILLAVGVFTAAVSAMGLGLASAPVAFMGAAVLMLILRLISLREAYASVEWPVIVLLAAMIPLGTAFETTGGASLIAGKLLAAKGALDARGLVWLMLLCAMALTPLINNAAAAILLAPIGMSLAKGLGVSADPFLMAVCVGCSCDFLTPIGHQSNTLVMGPGGYKFGDYARMGLFIELLIAVAAVPLILRFWPLTG